MRSLFCIPVFYLLFLPAESAAVQTVTDSTAPGMLAIPLRPTGAPTGAEFIRAVSGLSPTEREEAIFREISRGNIPDFLRNLVPIETVQKDAEGKKRKVAFFVTPDYLAIGSNDDFCSMPMTPQIAQRLAEMFGASLPTPKMVDIIYRNAELRLRPLPLSVTDSVRIHPATFLAHSGLITSQRISGGNPFGTLIAGTKKDVVITHRLVERPGSVFIYGWHRLNGNPIQPLYGGHTSSYVDYSHGIRLVDTRIKVDDVWMNLRSLISDPVLFTLLSDQPIAFADRLYLKNENSNHERE